MTLSEKNQLFIDSIWHWIIDGLEQMELGKTNKKSEFLTEWDDGSICKLNGLYCPLCIHFQDNCIICFIHNWDHHSKNCYKVYNNYDKNCCKAYNNYDKKRDIESCNGVINYLWNVGINLTKCEYETI